MTRFVHIAQIRRLGAAFLVAHCAVVASCGSDDANTTSGTGGTHITGNTAGSAGTSPGAGGATNVGTGEGGSGGDSNVGGSIGGIGGAGGQGGSGVGGGGGQGGSAGAMVSACSSDSPKYKISYPTPNGPFDLIKLPAGNNYYLGDNVWGPSVGVTNVGALTLWVQSESCWGVVADDPVNTDNPKGYPYVKRGWSNDCGASTGFVLNNRGGMDIQVTQLKKARLRWTMKAPATGRYQSLIDIYFHNSDNARCSDKIVTDLMINEYIVDNGYYATITAKDPVVTLDGHKFRAHINHAFSSNYTIQLTLVDAIAGNLIGAQDLTLDLKAVIDYFRQSNLDINDTDGHPINTPLIDDTEYLTSINAGWEVNVGGTYMTTNFWTALQDEADGP